MPVGVERMDRRQLPEQISDADGSLPRRTRSRDNFLEKWRYRPQSVRPPMRTSSVRKNAVYRPLSEGPELQVSESDLSFGPLRPCGAALAHSDYGPVPDGIERMVCGPDEKQKIAQAVRRSAKDHEGNRTRTQIVLVGDVLIDSD